MRNIQILLRDLISKAVFEYKIHWLTFVRHPRFIGLQVLLLFVPDPVLSATFDKSCPRFRCRLICFPVILIVS